jgi:hypothetical protein
MTAYGKEDMIYNGTKLDWFGFGAYNATSGMVQHQVASEQVKQDEGPIPEGVYSLPVKLAGNAKVDRQGNLGGGYNGIEAIPTVEIDGKKYWWPEWGRNRVRLTKLHIDNPKARGRDGFFLHDSTKGYTHGCIEIDTHFFERLRLHAAAAVQLGVKKILLLKVAYPAKDATTNGGTLVK